MTSTDIRRAEHDPPPHRAWLSLGANLGDRAGTLSAALSRIDALPDTELVRASSLYATAPVGFVDQPEFLNCAAEIATALPPLDLLHRLRSIEKELGRRPRARWHEREIDIDMLLYDRCIIADQELTLPHPEMHRRAFVLVPLAEIAANVTEPLNDSSVAVMLEALDSEDLAGVRILDSAD